MITYVSSVCFYQKAPKPNNLSVLRNSFQTQSKPRKLSNWTNTVQGLKSSTSLSALLPGPKLPNCTIRVAKTKEARRQHSRWCFKADRAGGKFDDWRRELRIRRAAQHHWRKVWWHSPCDRSVKNSNTLHSIKFVSMKSCTFSLLEIGSFFGMNNTILPQNTKAFFSYEKSNQKNRMDTAHSDQNMCRHLLNT